MKDCPVPCQDPSFCGEGGECKILPADPTDPFACAISKCESTFGFVGCDQPLDDVCSTPEKPVGKRCQEGFACKVIQPSLLDCPKTICEEIPFKCPEPQCSNVGKRCGRNKTCVSKFSSSLGCTKFLCKKNPKKVCPAVDLPVCKEDTCGKNKVCKVKRRTRYKCARLACKVRNTGVNLTNRR
jgi:hypothetical protein